MITEDASVISMDMRSPNGMEEKDVQDRGRWSRAIQQATRWRWPVRSVRLVNILISAQRTLWCYVIEEFTHET